MSSEVWKFIQGIICRRKIIKELGVHQDPISGPTADPENNTSIETTGKQINIENGSGCFEIKHQEVDEKVGDLGSEAAIFSAEIACLKYFVCQSGI